MNNQPRGVVSAREAPPEGFVGCSFIHLPKDLHRGGPLHSHFIPEDETHAAKDRTEGNYYRQCCRVPGLLLLEKQGDSSCRERLVVSSPGKHLETVAAVWGREGKLVCGDVINRLVLGDLYRLCIEIWTRDQSPQKEERGPRISPYSSDFLMVHAEMEHERGRECISGL